MTEIMMRLKSETRTEHRATESTALATAMLEGTMTRAEYEAQLAAYLAMHAAVEEAAARLPRVWGVLGGSSKSARLRSDLASLGMAVLPDLGMPLTRAVHGFCARIDASGEAELLGTIYVLEGSALGAAILLPRVQKALGLADAAFSYYRGDGPATMDRWRRFGAQMNAALSDPLEQERALSAARATFLDIRTLFEAVRGAESGFQLRVGRSGARSSVFPQSAREIGS